MARKKKTKARRRLGKNVRMANLRPKKLKPFPPLPNGKPGRHGILWTAEERKAAGRLHKQVALFPDFELPEGWPLRGVIPKIGDDKPHIVALASHMGRTPNEVMGNAVHHCTDCSKGRCLYGVYRQNKEEKAARAKEARKGKPRRSRKPRASRARQPTLLAMLEQMARLETKLDKVIELL